MIDCSCNQGERVVLLSEDAEPIGTELKSLVHTGETPLHSAFSIFLFDRRGQMLVQRRALHKATWAGVWSNACCGHPEPGESLMSAANRRLKEELGLEGVSLKVALPSFRYRAKWRGVWENEVCPVLIGRVDDSHNIEINTDEVESVGWLSWEEFYSSITRSEDHEYTHFSPWCLLETKLLAKSPSMASLIGEAI